MNSQSNPFQVGQVSFHSTSLVKRVHVERDKSIVNRIEKTRSDRGDPNFEAEREARSISSMSEACIEALLNVGPEAEVLGATPDQANAATGNGTDPFGDGGQKRVGGGDGGIRQNEKKPSPGDGTEEQNLNQQGNPGERITQDDVDKAFKKSN